jgi:hypothetical protein
MGRLLEPHMLPAALTHDRRHMWVIHQPRPKAKHHNTCHADQSRNPETPARCKVKGAYDVASGKPLPTGGVTARKGSRRFPVVDSRVNLLRRIRLTLTTTIDLPDEGADLIKDLGTRLALTVHITSDHRQVIGMRLLDDLTVSPVSTYRNNSTADCHECRADDDLHHVGRPLTPWSRRRVGRTSARPVSPLVRTEDQRGWSFRQAQAGQTARKLMGSFRPPLPLL